MYNGFSKYIVHNKHSEKLITSIKQAAEEYIGKPINALNFSRFKIFSETGSRIEYEADYMEHRKRLNVFAIMSMYEDNPVYLKELEDIIWAICDEFTWILPAHTYMVHDEKKPENYEEAIDLFSAETGVYLSEVLYIVGDRLNKLVKQRAEYEVKKRITEPYLKYRQCWGKNNWSGVCASAVGMAMIYLREDEKFKLCSADIKKSIDLFLESYENDGCCKEGSLYWSYGFGFMCYYGRLLRDYTKGAIDVFQNAKVRSIAEFGQNIFLDKNNTIPFSDAPHELNFNIGLFTFLSKEYGFSIPDEKYECVFGDDIRYRLCDLVRNFYWYDEKYTVREHKLEYYFYQDSMWYIKKQDLYSFAAKGGNNNEPHNHNDLGGFVLYADGMFIIDDLGWQEYDGNYFDERYRYRDYICASSAGHSVPIINMQYQTYGEDRYTTVDEVDEKSITYDLSRAYVGCGRIKRQFEFKDNGIQINDCYNQQVTTIIERFVTRIEPQIDKNIVKIGCWKLWCPNIEDINISTEVFKPRNTIVKSSMKSIETAYLIDFIIKKCPKNVNIYLEKN